MERVLDTNNDKELKLDDVFNPAALKNKAWVKENSSVLVFHGVGNQNPLETLDTFARGLLNAFCEYGGHSQKSLSLSHHQAKKKGDDNNLWFDNYVRITDSKTNVHLDIYEYYWANYPHGHVKMTDMQGWVESVVNGAMNSYAQKEFVERHGDRSCFTKDGEFRISHYKWTLKLAIIAIPFFTNFAEAILNGMRRIPLIGPYARTLFLRLQKSFLGILTNVAGDVVAYNTSDVKKELYEVRKHILNGAVKAIRYLIEPQYNSATKQKKLKYEKVIIAAHSLGSQISFDAFNRLSHLIAQDGVEGVDRNGTLLSPQTGDKHISELLSGYATFGSPLDKTAFFFREKSAPDAYLRRQMLAHFHCFKEKKWHAKQSPGEFELQSILPRYFNNIPWRNYYDNNDAVSGHLDYYSDVINLNACFVNKSADDVGVFSSLYPFTHSRYWNHTKMYGDIIANLLIHERD